MKIQNILQNRLIRNFMALSTVQAVNFLLPVATFPYLVRILGLEMFGVISFALAIVTYLISVVDYGFGLTATQEIAVNRNQPERMQDTFNKTLFTKLGLLFLCFCVLSVCVLFIPQMNKNWDVFMLSYLFLIGNALMPLWFFQGIEQMRYIAYFNLVARSLYFIGIFTLVNDTGDYLLVPLLNGLSSLLAAALALWWIVKQYRLKFQFPGFRAIRLKINDNFSVFVSGLSSAITINSGIIVLGFTTNDTTTGLYSALEKVLYLFRNILSLIFQVVFPRVCLLISQSHLEAAVFLQKVSRLSALATFFGGMVVFIAAPSVAFLFAGTTENGAVLILRILAFIPFVVALNMSAFQILMAYQHKSSYSTVLVSSAVINVFLLIVMSFYFGAIGAAVALLITELLITIGLNVSLRFRHPQHGIRY